MDVDVDDVILKSVYAYKHILLSFFNCQQEISVLHINYPLSNNDYISNRQLVQGNSSLLSSSFCSGFLSLSSLFHLWAWGLFAPFFHFKEM